MQYIYLMGLLETLFSHKDTYFIVKHYDQGFDYSVSVRKWSSRPLPPPRKCLSSTPPEPEKIARYLMLSAQKRQK